MEEGETSGRSGRQEKLGLGDRRAWEGSREAGAVAHFTGLAQRG